MAATIKTIVLYDLGEKSVEDKAAAEAVGLTVMTYANLL